MGKINPIFKNSFDDKLKRILAEHFKVHRDVGLGEGGKY